LIDSNTIMDTTKLNHLNDKVIRKQLRNYPTSNNIKKYIEAEFVINL
jgi:hypothetical protein